MIKIARRHVRTHSLFNILKYFASSASAVQRSPTDLETKFQRNRRKRDEIFSTEKERQAKLLTKIEKIDVKLVDVAGKEMKLKMNKDISTPYMCTMHTNDHYKNTAALALVNEKPYDMHRPLTEDCELKFLFFLDKEPHIVNQAYWRSCSFILGFILETAFKDEHSVMLHSWPSANFRTGSFVYDVQLDIGEWAPKFDELKMLSLVPAQELRKKEHPFERLEVGLAVAEAIFEDNSFKSEQLKYIAKSGSNNQKVTLYRVGDHVDISRGPMIANTSQLGFYNVTAFHPFESADFGPLCRVQGVSVPSALRVNSWTWEIVCNAAKRQNVLPLPSKDRYNAFVKKS